jgi:hypothetical protein
MVGVLHRKHDMVNPVVAEFLEEEKNFFISCASVFKKFDGIGGKFSIIGKRNPKPEVTYDPCRYIRGGEIIKSKPYDDELMNKNRSKTMVNKIEEPVNKPTNSGQRGSLNPDGINRMSMNQFNQVVENNNINTFEPNPMNNNYNNFNNFNNNGVNNNVNFNKYSDNNQNPNQFNFNYQQQQQNIHTNNVNPSHHTSQFNPSGFRSSNVHDDQFETQNKAFDEFSNFNNNFSNSNKRTSINNQQSPPYTDTNNNQNNFNFSFGGSFAPGGMNQMNQNSHPVNPNNNPKKADDVFKDLF